MKTKIAKPLLSAVLMMCCTVMNAQYETFQAGGIMYTVTGENTVEVGQNYNFSGSVEIPATVTNPDGGKTYNVTGIGNHAFFLSDGITSVTIPEGLISIGDEAFSYCRNIKGDLVIPSTVTSIGKDAFSLCDNLTSVTIKGGSIGSYAFYNCKGLTSLSLQEGVTSIGEQAFYSCLKLKGDLVIPSTVKSIGECAFEDIPVNTVKVFALVPPELGYNAFSPVVSFYVPDVKKYQACDGWKDYIIKLLTEFRLGDIMYQLNETGEHFGEDLTFNDKDLYVSCSDFTANKLTYSRTFKDTNWQPLYVPFAMSYDEWKGNFEVAAINNFHEYTDDKGQTVKTELEVRLVKDHTLKPNHPYLIRAKMANNYNPQEINLSTKKLCKSDENSIVCSSVERKYTFTGTYRDITGMRTDDYIFMSGGKLCKAVDDGVKLSAQRWYLSIESLGSQFGDGDPSYARAMEFDIKLLNDEATGIDEITVTRTPLTDDSETIYNLNGMRVSDSYKGIVIKNGKKIYQW